MWALGGAGLLGIGRIPVAVPVWKSVLKGVIILMTILILTGCGGGGGGGSLPTNPPPDTPPTNPDPPSPPDTPPTNPPPPDPPPPPDTPPTNPPPDPPSPPRQPVGYGKWTAPGINRIPLSAIKLTNQQVAKQFAVVEYTENEDGTPSSHAKDVMQVACHSYITGCKDHLDFTTTPYSWHKGHNVRDGFIVETTEEIQRRLDTIVKNGVKVISYSLFGNNPSILRRADASFVSVEAAGNYSTENFFNETQLEIFSLYQNDVANLKAAGATHKVLFVAGYTQTPDGTYIRDPKSTGCTGIDAYCLYAPFRFGTYSDFSDGVNSGTSLSTPHVAAALASVLAVFPDTEGVELIRLAKACAVATPTLSGLGRADFGCMTTLDEHGDWQVVGNTTFASLIAPTAMHRMVFPGTTKVQGTFVKKTTTAPSAVPNTITLGVTHHGTFAQSGFSAGVPTGIPTQEGFSPILVGTPGNNALGMAYKDTTLFASVTYGDRPAFFGLVYGYRGTGSLDASVGHQNLFVRYSKQWSIGNGALELAEGTALGITAQRQVVLHEHLTLHGSVTADRFMGGTAQTTFGTVGIAPSAWVERANVSLAYTPTPDTNLTVDVFSALADTSALSVAVGLTQRF